MSSATWFAQDELVATLLAHQFQPDSKIYCDVGTEETSLPTLAEYPQIYLQGNQQMVATLAQQLTPSQLRFEVARNANHSEAAWSKRLPSALSWLMQ